MPEYVAKLRARVRIGRPGEETIEGVVALAPRARFHDGPETILERLNPQPVR